MSKPHGVTMLLTHSKKKISQVVIALFLTQSGATMADIGDFEIPESSDSLESITAPEDWPVEGIEVDLKGGAAMIDGFVGDSLGVLDLKGAVAYDPSWVDNNWARNVLYVTNLSTEAPNALTIRVHGVKAPNESIWQHGVGVAMYTKDDDGMDRHVNLELNGGATAFLINPRQAFSDEAQDLTQRIQLAYPALNQGLNFMNDLGRAKVNALYVDGRLNVHNDTSIVLGADLVWAQKEGWNLYMGTNSVLIFDGTQNLDTEASVGGITLEDGAKAHFEKGAGILIMHPTKDLDPDIGDFVLVRETPTGDRFIEAAEGATIEGLENCVTVVFKDNQVFEVGFTLTDGGWVMNEKVWKPSGFFAASLGAMYSQIDNGTAPTVLSDYYKKWVLLDDFAQHVATVSFLQKQLGTTTAMDRQVMDGALNGIHATRRYETLLPVDVEFLKSQSEGEAGGLDVSNDLVGLGYERESDGFAISVNGRYLNHYAGVRVAYDDADVKLENRTFRKGSHIEATSTILTASAYAGTKYDWGYLTGHLSYAGAEDKTRVLGGFESVVGAEEISRRALSLGVASTFVKEGEWLDAGLTVGGYMTYFLPVDYTVAINGQDAWQLKESKRLVWTGHVGADVSKLWHPTPKSFLKVNLEGGVRMRAGDTDVTQTMSMGGVESSETTEDLARGEAYASLRFDGKLRDGRFGAGVTQAMGPDGVKHTSAEFHVTFDLE